MSNEKDHSDLAREGKLEEALTRGVAEAITIMPPSEESQPRHVLDLTTGEVQEGGWRPLNLTLASLMTQTLPIPRWAVEGMIPEGYTVLGGKQKMGKSWFMYMMGIAVASGEDFLNMPTRAGDVLYLSLEDNLYRLQERGTKLLRDQPVPPNLYLETSWPRFDEGGITYLEAWLELHPAARLVMIDTYAIVKPKGARGANAYDEEYTNARLVKALADKYHVAIVAVTHLRKAGAEDWVDTFVQSTGLTAGADAIVQLARKRGDADAVLNAAGRALPCELSLALTFDYDTARWQNNGDASEVMIADTKGAILKVLKQSNKALAPAEVHRILRDLGNDFQPDNIRKTMQRMLDKDGLLTATVGGKYMAVEHPLQKLSRLSR